MCKVVIGFWNVTSFEAFVWVIGANMLSNSSPKLISRTFRSLSKFSGLSKVLLCLKNSFPGVLPFLLFIFSQVLNSSLE